MAYRDTFAYKLIYVMTIPDEDHKGLLKIGEATLASSAVELPSAQERGHSEGL